MCAAVDMLASQQIFYGHSPPTSFLADYAPPRRMPPRGLSAPCLPMLKTVQLNLKSAPRSCLLRSDVDKSKKRVVFADDRGLALEHVRVMTEPSHVPPYWTLRIFASPPPQRKAAQLPPDRWECKFSQPASDYLEFRRRITEDCVALENVIVKQVEGALDGTVKVKNLDFNKEVYVRASADGWRTHEDTYCAFSESGPMGTDGCSMYDTFAFRLQLPIHSRRLDFCVCFRCKDDEHWDSNFGKNYTVEQHSVSVNTSAQCFARVKSGNSWSSRTDPGNTPYW